MAFSASGGNGGRPGMMSEINVTPLVDVMLVLLIIFMVTAPMMTQGLDVNLPKVDSQALQTEQQQTILTIKADGTIFLDEFAVPVANLAYQEDPLPFRKESLPGLQTKGLKIFFPSGGKIYIILMSVSRGFTEKWRQNLW